MSSTVAAAPADAAVSNPVVTVKDATFRYFEETEFAVTGVNLEVHAGERIVVVGHNGSGKSTLLKLIAGKNMVQQGSVTVLGTDAFNDTTLNFKVAHIASPWPPEAYFATTVDRMTTPYPDAARREKLLQVANMRLTSKVDLFSSGQKRRAQCVCGLLHNVSLALLDECSTDIDLPERTALLDFIQEECQQKGVACLYATHILDGLESWATRVIHMVDGKIVRDLPVASITTPLSPTAYTWLAKSSLPPFPPQPGQSTEVVLSGNHFAHKHTLKDISFSITRGSRVLLFGCNGCGKTTLLSLLAGRSFTPNANNSLQALGRPCFQDTRLNTEITLCGNWWTKAPPGEMRVYELCPCPLTARGMRLATLLNINMQWDVQYISSGEMKRVQLLLQLVDERPIVLLDEATADLDVDQRHVLLQFLWEDSTMRGVTVMYATHIFEGLSNWATHAMILNGADGVVDRFGSAETYPVADCVKRLFELKKLEGPA